MSNEDQTKADEGESWTVYGTCIMDIFANVNANFQPSSLLEIFADIRQRT